MNVYIQEEQTTVLKYKSDLLSALTPLLDAKFFSTATTRLNTLYTRIDSSRLEPESGTMSQDPHMTFRISMQLILAQVVVSRREIEDARRYVERMLTGLCLGPCSVCQLKPENRQTPNLPLDDHEDDEEKDLDTDKWTV